MPKQQVFVLLWTSTFLLPSLYTAFGRTCAGVQPWPWIRFYKKRLNGRHNNSRPNITHHRFVVGQLCCVHMFSINVANQISSPSALIFIDLSFLQRSRYNFPPWAVHLNLSRIFDIQRIVHLLTLHFSKIQVLNQTTNKSRRMLLPLP